MSANSSLSTLLDVIGQRMTYLNQRQSVLAENVANADTPGYKQLDLKPVNFGDVLKQAQTDGAALVVTDPRHIVPASQSGTNAKTFAVKGNEATMTGNTVDLEQQMMEVSKNSVDYQTLAALYHKVSGLFKIAIKGSST